MRLIIATVLILLCFNISDASFGRIVDLGPFDLEEVENIDSTLLRYVFDTIDHIRCEESVKAFYDLVFLENVYKFNSLPGLYLFRVGDGRFRSGPGWDIDPYEAFLYNSCDSTVYPFEMGYVRFSKTLKSFLPEIIKDKYAIKELVMLYLECRYNDIEYEIIESPEEYRNLCINSRTERSSRRFRSLTDGEIELEIKEMIRWLDMFEILKKDEGYYEVIASTWNELGHIESWRFWISEDVFEVHEHILMIINMGPQYWWNYRPTKHITPSY